MKRKINPLPFIVIAGFVLLLNWYVLSGIQTIINPLWISPVFWTFILLVVAGLLFSIQRFGKQGADLFFTISTHTFLILLTSELVFIAVLFLGDGYRLLSGGVRSKYWVEFGMVLFFITVLLFLYGIIRGKYAYRVIRHTLFFEELPEAFDGFSITQISDVHSGSFKSPSSVQKGIDLIKAQQSDLFVFTGDLVNNKAEEIVPWISRFSQIKAPYGQFSILGNHDYGDYIKWPDETSKRKNLDDLKKHHQEMGYRLLLDEHVEIHKEGQKIILAGVENWGLGFGERGDLDKALRNTDTQDFKVLLSHDPTHWESQVKQSPMNVHLTLSGHTHGMQFGIEAFGIKWSPVKYRYAHWAGIAVDNGRYLNINRGFGFLGFSGRVGIWPEITVITLKKTRQ